MCCYFAVYWQLDAVRSVLRAKAANEFDDSNETTSASSAPIRAVRVFFITEQAPSDSQVLEYSGRGGGALSGPGSGPGSLHRVYVTRLLSPVCSNVTK